MLLKSPVNDSSFLNVSTLLISSSSLNPDAERIGGSIADFRVRLPNYLTNVVGLELEEYSIPINSLSQFTDRNKIDFRMRNPSIFGGQWKTFELTLPSTTTTNAPSSRNSDLTSVLLASFAELIRLDPDFGGKVEIKTTYTDVYLTLSCKTLIFAGWLGPNSTECELLFGTGANKGKSAGPYLGFEEVDYVMEIRDLYGIPIRTVSGDKEAVINVYRFLDVFIDEFSTTEPWYRVFVPSISSLSAVQPELNFRVRMLDVPIRKANTLTFHLRLQGGVRPLTPEAFYFNIKVFELKTTPNMLPSYSKRSQLM